jgi:hypothetical protein
VKTNAGYPRRRAKFQKMMKGRPCLDRGFTRNEAADVLREKVCVTAEGVYNSMIDDRIDRIDHILVSIQTVRVSIFF